MKVSGRSLGQTQQLVLVASYCFGLVVADAVPAHAQQRGKIVRTSHSRERAKELIDEYTDSIDSDYDFDRPATNDRRRNQGHGEVDANTIRPLIRSFSDSLKQLTYSLNEQMDQVSGMRQLYTEALRLSGAAASIDRRAEKHGVDVQMLDDLQQLDADWHEVAYRLENVRGLSNEMRELVGDINDAAKRIRQAGGMQQQLDRRQLTIKAARLAADLENLQEDINSELGGNRDLPAYRRTISRVRQAVLNMVTTLRDDRTDTNLIVSEYKQFVSLWTPLLAKLRAEDDRNVDRDIRRVVTSVQEVHQLLLLPHEYDQSQFVYLAKQLKRDIDEFFDRTPLVLIMHLPNSKQALPAAEQFYAACAKFTDVVNHSQDQGDVIEAFQRVEQAERAFSDAYRDIDSDKAGAVLARIVRTTNSLRTALQIQRDDYDGNSAENLAASIQNYTDRIATICRHWFDQEHPSFAHECLQETAELANSAAHLHDLILDGRHSDELTESMTDVHERWRRVYGYLIKCQTDDRPALGRLATALTPSIVDLRATVMH